MARYVTVCAVAWSASPGQSVADARETAVGLLRQAAVAKPDLVVYPEMCLHTGLPFKAWLQADPLPNALSDLFGALAREYHLNLVLPMPVQDGDHVYNSAVVIDRRGEIAGRYDKRHVTIGELEAGIAPGSNLGVTALDFGRIAHAICFDVNFLREAEALQEYDIDLLCVHSMFCGGQLLAQWALTVGAPLISAYMEDSRLYDMTGSELARIGYRYELFRHWKMAPILTARLNLDRRLFHIDCNAADFDGRHGGLHRLLAERADQVSVDYNFDAGVFALGALEGASLPELAESYGLVTRNTYFRQACEADRDARMTVP